jgi:hypothetical protein
VKTWSQAFQDALVSGSAASVLSAAALAICGKMEPGATAVGPLNGPSQWIWGESAARKRTASIRTTLTGYAIHHLSAIFWATFYERFLRSANRRESMPSLLGKGAATAAMASFVDYQLTPPRLQPGFEKQLSPKSLFFVYSAVAVGLALAGCAGRGRRVP